MDIASKQKQIRNSAIYIIAVVANNLISLIALPIFTRILSKEDYGIFALAEVYGLFVSGLANFGMIISYNRNFFKYYNDRNDTAKLLYSTLLFTSTIFLLLFSLT
ncbi:MAG: oligosaccharide flippase family protein [Candidatus Omnitrophica bacterium]|nr:oligosaccharide flippase family protein [Candidatus Omnitrophota bacterium]